MIAPDDARASLERILASEPFAKAGRLARFLRFAAERSLAGEGADLKEYRIGTEVFDRPADFDPRLDPIVRVEARRLRTKLQEYYEAPGRGDSVRLVLPKGGYAVSWELIATEPAAAPPAAEARRPKWVWVAALTLAVAGVAAGVVALRPNEASPRPIVVLPFGEQPWADGLGEAVSAELVRNSALRVIAYRRVLEYRQQHGAVDVEDAADLDADAVLALSVERAGERRRVTAVLMMPKEGWKRWAGEYERAVGDDFAVQREVARAVAEELRGRLP